MANTEGISDEDMLKLLSLENDNHKTSSSVPRGLLQRQKMMDDFEIGGHSRPAAKVIRSSKAPIIKSPKLSQGQSNDGKGADKSFVSFSESSTDAQEKKSVEDGQRNIEESDIRPAPVSVLKSDLVQERKISTIANENNPPKKISRFKMKRQQEAATDVPATNSGFPSFDIPIGSLTRKGKKILTNESAEKKKLDPKRIFPKDNDPKHTVSEAESMIANMSVEDIQESIAEIESVLSPETIFFLKNRKKKTNQIDSKGSNLKKVVFEETIGKEPGPMSYAREKMVHDKKEVSDTLSKIRTEEELDALYEKVMGEPLSFDDNTHDESELEQATKLLRSTSARQRLLGAKTVCSLLEQRLAGISKDGSDFPIDDVQSYPLFLPVALRCLLDVPSPQKHIELISYVVRSISVLVNLFSNSSYRVDCSKFIDLSNSLPTVIYQRDYMRDAVPLLSLSQVSPQIESNSSKESNLGNGLYATNATSDSAQIDAKSFYDDPSWTLLSKMRIIPSVSYILENIMKSIDHSGHRPDNSIVSICSIMAMLSLRSPGAAVAIAQHKVILFTLSQLGLSPGSDEIFVVNAVVALPIIQFFCILSRQSRVCAKAVSVVIGDIICILSSSAESVDEIELQRWCIILWRTLLRYGIGISYLSTVLQISIPSLSNTVHDSKSLAPEYLSAYSVICACVKIKSQQNINDSSSQGINLGKNDEDTLMLSGMWLSAHAKSCYENLVLGKAHSYKFISSMLYFVSSFFAATSANKGKKEFDSQIASPVVQIPIISIENMISVLEKVLGAEIFSDSLHVVFSFQTDALIEDAVACSLVESFFNALDNVYDKIEAMRASPEESKISSDIEMAISMLEQQLCTKIISIFQCRSPKNKLESDIAQDTWKSFAQAVVIKFVTSSKFLLDDLHNVYMIQSMAVRLIGTFQIGQESSAVLLLSRDMIFTVFDAHQTCFVLSGIQNMMLNQLCSPPSSQRQLDHSFKLNGRSGIWSNGRGHFDTESLRSEVDQMNTGSSITEQVKLPFGQEWIWHILSSHASLVDENDQTFAVITQSMVEAIQYLYYAEVVGMEFTRDMSAGSKMYFLLNCVLSPETVLRHEQFQIEFLKLLEVYSEQFLLDEKTCGRDFIITCYKHSKHFIEKSKDTSDVKFNKVLDLFFGDQNIISNEMALSSKDLKAVDEFVSDICTAFAEFGAQYDFFIQAIRILLMRGMSFRVRNGVLSNLKDVLHLFTTQVEVSDESNLKLQTSLQRCLLGGLRTVDNSLREHAGYLDTLISGLVMKNSTNLRRRDFFYLLAVASVARELVAFAIKCECGTMSLKRKLTQLDHRIWADISRSAVECDKLKCSDPTTLTRVVMSCCFSYSDANDTVDDFDTVVAKIRSNSH